MYGNSLKIVVESVTHGYGSFLQYDISCDKRIVLSEYNKSWSRFIKDKKYRVRFPDLVGFWNKKLYVGTMVSQLLGMCRRSNDNDMLKYDGINLIREWVAKGYYINWVKEAVYKVASEATDFWINILKRIG